ncbi:hydroxymethylbilane synthase [Wigglesworthia glossinidia endosymbiont of Glossina morsitans morsitans (Yale colony)]|uniref:Hydroxymethylbilane synthase n=1 Tax=Wigglesworthia glossinidia endosymbiont of Glossina morsitans morsitans (Yale colony) TaxID=1142511 RepID=H6Q577_WIGGL|nr:hydroxymethylbilane synthase [Wigglesworthia glossinidia]AFA41360.1 hydroxymethylbilane synthase [Wigglesworthia glossinidia endosymbiont of Glossina morsitans morsitans (Yale colony)]
MKNSCLIIATRTSPLAIWQANHVKKKLLYYHPYLNISLLPLLTSGDIFKKNTQNQIQNKSSFINELEKSLLEYQSDIAVHSMKDFTSPLSNKLGIAAICKRGDPRDAIVSKYYKNIYSLPRKAIIGTSSIRRKFQLLLLRPDLIVYPLRGNIHSRINKLFQGHFHAIILAVAALKRLQINKKLYTPLNLTNMIPAMGQGAIMVQYRLNDHKILDLVNLIHDKETAICVNSEKTIISKLAIGCRIPIGVYAKIKQKSQIWIKTIVGSVNGSTIIRSEGQSDISEAKQLSYKQVQKLINQGAKKIIKSL